MSNPEQKIQPMQIHYYFDNESHSMNALVRNRAEKDLLDAIRRVGELTGHELVIETQAYREGGLIEILAVVVPTLHYLSPSINGLIQYYFTRDKEIDELQKKKLVQEVRKLELDNQIKDTELQQLFDDKQAIRHVSNYYKRIDGYPKVTRIGFKRSEDTKEIVVYREQFQDFILMIMLRSKLYLLF